MKNMVLVKDRKRSWRLRILFTVLLGAIVYYLFFPKSENTNKTSPDFFIPPDHQEKRFNYVSFSETSFYSEDNARYFSVDVKNDSYIYDLKNVNLVIKYFSDEKMTKLIDTEYYYGKINSIPSLDEYKLIQQIPEKVTGKYWLSIYADQLELVKKIN